jgi:hypothetical protein
MKKKRILKIDTKNFLSREKFFSFGEKKKKEKLDRNWKYSTKYIKN